MLGTRALGSNPRAARRASTSGMYGPPSLNPTNRELSLDPDKLTEGLTGAFHDRQVVTLCVHFQERALKAQLRLIPIEFQCNSRSIYFE